VGTDVGENVSMQYVCVFITAGPIINYKAVRVGDRGGHEQYRS